VQIVACLVEAEAAGDAFGYRVVLTLRGRIREIGD
jgi:hypothetical protein